MARKKDGEKQLQWRGIVGRQAKSGLSIREFCAKEEISQASFYAWRRRLRQEGKTSMPSEDGEHGIDKARHGREFIPLKLLDSAAAWEVVHPLGYRVRVSGELNILDAP
jgi:transposase